MVQLGSMREVALLDREEPFLALPRDLVFHTATDQ